jgi:hypothetical protein
MAIRKAKSKAQNHIDLTISKENSEKAAKILWLIADDLDLSPADLSVLMDVQERTIYNSRVNKTLPLPCNDRYRRIGLLLGIKKNLEILFPRNEEVRKNWLHVPRSIFKGLSAMDMIRSEPVESMSRLFTVRRLLDMYRNGSLNELT